MLLTPMYPFSRVQLFLYSHDYSRCAINQLPLSNTRLYHLHSPKLTVTIYKVCIQVSNDYAVLQHIDFVVFLWCQAPCSLGLRGIGSNVSTSFSLIKSTSSTFVKIYTFCFANLSNYGYSQCFIGYLSWLLQDSKNYSNFGTWNQAIQFKCPAGQTHAVERR